MTRSISIFAACLGLLLASPARGQTPAQAARHQLDCRAAAEVLSAGASEARQKWALGWIRHCGNDEWARNINVALLRTRASTDVDLLEDLWFATQQLRDARLYQTAVLIAGDRSASVPSRVLALRGLRWLARGPDRIVDGYEAMVSGPDPLARERGWCSDRPVSGWTWYENRPLPADFRERILELAARLKVDSTQPREVRSAANCV